MAQPPTLESPYLLTAHSGKTLSSGFPLLSSLPVHPERVN
jgi:hypothetical protein